MYFLFFIFIKNPEKNRPVHKSQGRGDATVTWEVALDSSLQGALNDVLIL